MRLDGGPRAARGAEGTGSRASRTLRGVRRPQDAALAPLHMVQSFPRGKHSRATRVVLDSPSDMSSCGTTSSSTKDCRSLHRREHLRGKEDRSQFRPGQCPRSPEI